MECLDLAVERDPEDHKAREEWMALKVFLVQSVKRANLVLRLLANQYRTEKRDSPVNLDNLDQLDKREGAVTEDPED